MSTTKTETELDIMRRRRFNTRKNSCARKGHKRTDMRPCLQTTTQTEIDIMRKMSSLTHEH